MTRSGSHRAVKAVKVDGNSTRWESALDCAQLGVWDADLVRGTCYYSPSWKRMIGYEDDELPNVSDLWLKFVHPEDRQKALDSGDQHLAGLTGLIETEFRLQHRDGRWVWVLDRGRVIERDGLGQPTRMIGVQTDITAQKEAARRDGLTGLLNRAAFEAELTSLIETTTNTSGYALFYIDLDRFKFVNDTVGHAAGDAILKLVAKSLELLTGPETVVARLGGDEFAILVEVLDRDAAHALATQIVNRVRGQRLLWEGQFYNVGASVGVAMLDEVDLHPVTVLAHADAACYAAKSLGRDRAVVYHAQMGDSASGLADVRAASDLMDALKEGRLRLYAQEIRDLSDLAGPCRHVEILARLVASDGSLLLPGRIIPAAERFGLMGAFDRRVIRQALQELKANPIEADGLTLSINLSAQSLSDPDLWSFVEATMAECAIAPARLCFEITETAAINDFDSAEKFVSLARKAGCRISLDDFGSGLSSFAYLRRFAVDCIKIDGAFVEDVGQDNFNRSICAAIGMIAAELGVDVIAEKIEDTSAIDVLLASGIGYGQGFLMHRPEPLADLFRRRGRQTVPGRNVIPAGSVGG